MNDQERQQSNLLPISEVTGKHQADIGIERCAGNENTTQTQKTMTAQKEYYEDSSKDPFNSDKEKLVNLSPKKENADDIASMISHIVGRVCEDSVASDVSGLTDADIFRTEDFHSSPTNAHSVETVVQNESLSSSKNKKNFKSVVRRAPNAPAVSGALTDIESENTSTTVSSSHEEKTPKSRKRSVSFCDVQVRNYERVLELNPSVTSGPALGIGWKYSVEQEYSVENFEDSRENFRRHSMKELAVSRDEREDILRSLGYSQKEIAGSVRAIIRAKNQRKQTIHNLHVSSMEEFMEKATRKVKRVLLFPLHNRKKAKALYSYPTQSPLSAKTLDSCALKKTSLRA